MPMKKTTDQFIHEAKTIHGDKFDYTKVNYISARTKVIILCSVHGEFVQTPNKHLIGQGCPYCAGKHKTCQDTLDDFIEIHGDLYDYSLVEYKNVHTKVKIVCKEHGIFEQLPLAHKRGSGCPKCYGRGKTQEEILHQLHEVHGNIYEYKLSNFKGTKEKIEVLCKTHGVFYKPVTKLLRGEGCPFCSNDRTASKLSHSAEDFIQKSKLIHGDTYNYSKIVYKNAKTLVRINCTIHGFFEQLPDVHLSGSGCPSCAEHGFNPSTPASIYVLTSIDLKFMKIGISNNVKSRISKLRKKTPFKFKKIKEFSFAIGMKAFLTEQTAHKLLVTAGLQGFDGSTEWFLYNLNIIEFLNKECNSFQNDEPIDNVNSEKISVSRQVRQEQFIESSRLVHNDRYDYSLIDYVNSNIKVKIICPIHGVFEQIPSSHKKGIGCSRCSGYKKTTEDAISGFRKTHGDVFDYSKVEYLNSKTKVKIICHAHGEFEQTPDNHLQGCGCPVCGLFKNRMK